MLSFWRVIFLFMFLLAISCSPQAQNIALDKPYTLSTPPNYRYSAPSTDKISLTDGVFTNSQFWKNPSTVGWQNRQVTITIDLLKIEPIKSVFFNTARKSSVGVEFPQNIFVFLSDDNNKYHFAGDAANSSENESGDYKIHKFSLDQINSEARYVKIVVVPNGKRIFCDEIEIFKGIHSKRTEQDIDKRNVESYADSLISVASNSRRLKNVVNGLELKNEFLKKQLEENPDEAETILFKSISESLQRKFNTPFVVNKVNPWDSINEFYEPENDSSILDYEFFNVSGINKYAAFTITNTAKTLEDFTFNILNGPNTNISLFHVPFVPSGKNFYVPDPLVPMDKLEIIPGSTQLFIFQLSSGPSGNSTAKIEIEASSKKVTLNIGINTIKLDEDVVSNLPNANIWAYLNTPILTGIEGEAGKDLAKHHINTVVINSRILPKMGSSDYSDLIDYLKNFEKAENILLFTRFSSKGKGESGADFMAPKWKQSFSDWYKNIARTIHENGFPEAKIFLYPYDEVRGKDIQDFESFAIWGKKEIPGLKIFATISNEEAKRKILPLVDIAQIQVKKDLLRNLPAHTAEIWTYENGSPARALSPYQFYRLKAWRAFFDDVQGVGFWSYSSENKELDRNHYSENLSVPTASYSVIYNGDDNSIISSRRWEAFSLGLEDYAILKIYANKYGKDKTKNLVKTVLESPDDLEKADVVIEKMIKELGKDSR